MKVRCWQGCVPSETCRGIFLASAFAGLLVGFGVPCLAAYIHHSGLCLCLHTTSFPCLSMSSCGHLFRGTAVVLKEGLPLLRSGLILTNYVCKALFSNKVTF